MQKHLDQKSTVNFFCKSASPLYFSLRRILFIVVWFQASTFFQNIQAFLPVGVGVPSPSRCLQIPDAVFP